MTKDRNNFQLGITVIVMFLLFFACLLYIGGKGLFREEMRDFHVRLSAGPAMPEISKGSRIVCFGQPIGEVVATRLVQDTPPDDPDGEKTQYLEVHATAQAALDLREDCVVLATGPPLGGKGALEISNRGVSATPLPNDQPIYGQIVGFQTALTQLNQELDANNPDGLLSLIKGQLDAGNRESLVAKVHNSLGHVNAMTASLARELDRTHEDRLLYKVHSGLAKIDVGLTELVGILQDNRPRIDNTLRSVEHATRVADAQILTPLADEFDADREGGLLAELHAAFERLNRSLADVNAITTESKRVVVLNSGRIDELVQNATEASILLRNGIKDVMLHPWKMFVKPSSAEKRELHILSIAREFAEAAAHLDDSTSRLQALIKAQEGNIDSADADLTEIRANLARSVERFFNAEKALWREMQAE